METIKLIVGVLHEPQGTSCEFFWTFMNHVGWSNKRMQSEENLALDTVFVPKACDNHKESLQHIFNDIKSKSYRYFWLIHDQLIPATYSFIQFIKDEHLAVCGGYYNRSGRKYIGPVIPYSGTIVAPLNEHVEDVPRNFLCQREFLEFCDYDVETFLRKEVLFDGKYVADTLGKHGEYYPNEKTISKYLNPDELDIPFKFGGFRHLTEPVNISALTVPKEELEKIRAVTPEQLRSM